MKKTMDEFINTLSDNDYEVFEDLFNKKFRKFRKLFKLIKRYADYITSLQYNETDDDVLKIAMTVTKIDPESVVVDVIEVAEQLPDNGNVLAYNDKKVIYIEITLDESEMP